MRRHVEEGSLQNGSSCVVEVDIYPVWAGCSEFLPEIGRLVVDGFIKIEPRAENVALLMRACTQSAVAWAAAKDDTDERKQGW